MPGYISALCLLKDPFCDAQNANAIFVSGSPVTYKPKKFVVLKVMK